MVIKKLWPLECKDRDYMADIYLTISQLEQIFASLTLTMLNILFDPTTQSTNKNSPVRISWATDGAPAWNISDDVTFVKVLPDNDDYNKIRDMEYTPITGDNANVNQAMSYTRVIRVIWTIYGPNSEDNAQEIRDQMFYQSIHDTLADNNLYMITEIDEPVRAPELYCNQWWERVDMSVRFNELVTRNITIPYIAEIPITMTTGSPNPSPGINPILNPIPLGTSNTPTTTTPSPNEPNTIEISNVTIKTN
jgi:hypothetical protein